MRIDSAGALSWHGEKLGLTRQKHLIPWLYFGCATSFPGALGRTRPVLTNLGGKAPIPKPVRSEMTDLPGIMRLDCDPPTDSASFREIRFMAFRSADVGGPSGARVLPRQDFPGTQEKCRCRRLGRCAHPVHAAFVVDP